MNLVFAFIFAVRLCNVYLNGGFTRNGADIFNGYRYFVSFSVLLDFHIRKFEIRIGFSVTERIRNNFVVLVFARFIGFHNVIFVSRFGILIT